MRKLALVICLAIVLFLSCAHLTMAAPAVTLSQSYQLFYGGRFAGLEAGMALTDRLSVIGNGVTNVPGYFIQNLIRGGCRYYFADSGFRPFVSLYGGLVTINQYGTTTNSPFAMGTLGLEYLGETGHRIAFEAGYLYTGTFHLSGHTYQGFYSTSCLSFGFTF